MTQKKQYDLFVLLCAGGKKESNSFTILNKKNKYLGGPSRIKAAIKICKMTKKYNTKIIVVGGGLKENDENSFKKVNRMKKKLQNEGINENRIIRLVSKADTLGNLRAIYDKLRLIEKIKKRRKDKNRNYY